MRLHRFIALLLGLALFVQAVSADVLVMKDGRRIEGVVREETAKVVKIQTPLGLLEFKRSEVEKIERRKTKRQEFEERFEVGETASDFYELGVWADAKRLRRHAKKAMDRVIELEPDHVEARAYLGFVRYNDEWMTPEERELRMAADEDAKMLARGLVKYQENWVTPEEKVKLEAGLVIHDGRWIPFADAQRARGFELFEERWIRRSEAVARSAVASVEAVAEVSLNSHICADAMLAGNVDVAELQRVAAGVAKGRAWFDTVFKTPAGLELFGDHLPELYLFGTDDAPYKASTEHFATRSETLPEGWSAAVKRTHGFVWWDPWPVSSARRWKRGDTDLHGHCYHHWGHMLLNSVGYDGRLLPPWYDEAFASVMENRLHELNAVFCRAQAVTGGGTVAGGKTAWSFDPMLLRSGKWRKVLGKALDEGAVRDFDKLARKEFHDLDLIDVVVGMGVVEWMVAKGDVTAFHKVLRELSPAAPQRVLESVGERKKMYDRAFLAGTKMDMLAADKAWRAWFLSTGRNGVGEPGGGGRIR
jgi:hypothetical protein